MAFTPLPDNSPLLQAGALRTLADSRKFVLNNIASLHASISTGSTASGFPANAVIIGSAGGGLQGLTLNLGELLVGQGSDSDIKSPIALPKGQPGQVLEVANNGVPRWVNIDPDFNIGTVLIYDHLRHK